MAVKAVKMPLSMKLSPDKLDSVDVSQRLIAAGFSTLARD